MVTGGHVKIKGLINNYPMEDKTTSQLPNIIQFSFPIYRILNFSELGSFD